MRSVFKYPLDIGCTLLTVSGPQINHVGIDPTGEQQWPTVWIEQGDGPATLLRLWVHGTGHPIVRDGIHVGSVITTSGLVWHVYLEPDR